MYLSNNKAAKHYYNSSLARESFQLYESIAQDYIQLDRHWGDDSDIVLEVISNQEKVTLLDAGCGPGWYIRCCLESALESFEKIIGVDFSSAMIKQAEIYSMNSSKVILLKQNLLKIQKQFHDESIDVIICMNNVLGNLIIEDIPTALTARIKVLQQFQKILRNNGKLILSVYNRRLLNSNSYSDSNLFLDKTLSNPRTGDFVINVKLAGLPNNLRFYSHWFTKDELVNLLHNIGFRVFHIAFRNKRIVLSAEKSKDK